jgi:hypothetical protein
MIEESQLQLSDNLRVSISDENLISKTTDTEDTFTERKTASDTRGWLETAVAFANSCPIGIPGVLYVGVNNDGTIQQHKEAMNFEKLQKSISSRINEAWPPIFCLPKTLHKDNAEFIAVLVPGSPQRPHFSGHSYVRIGPETRKASEKQFDDLIAQRTSKIRALQKLVGQTVYWQQFGLYSGGANGKVVDCNQFYITIDGGQSKRCFPIEWITISFDPDNQRPHLIIYGL